MSNFKPKDIIAIVALIGIFSLKALGYNGGLDTAGALIFGYYFAHPVGYTQKGT